MWCAAATPGTGGSPCRCGRGWMTGSTGRRSRRSISPRWSPGTTDRDSMRRGGRGLALMPGGLKSCEHAIVSRSVLIVDDHAAFRGMARALLEADGFDVVGEAADGETALAEAA